MAEEIFLQHWVFTKFVFPFLLLFVLFYAVLEKVKIFGENKHRANALISLVIALIFVTVFNYVFVINNLILFLVIALVVVFVAMLLWGFVTGSASFSFDKPIAKWILGIVIAVAVTIAVLWATGVSDNLIELLFRQEWSGTFWTNFLFVVIVGIALALLLRGSKAGGSS